MIYFVLFLLIYICGIAAFPILVRNYAPISNFVRDVNNGESYKNYKECVSGLSLAWIVVLPAIALMYAWKWFSEITARHAGYQPKEAMKEVNPPGINLRGDTIESCGGWVPDDTEKPTETGNYTCPVLTKEQLMIMDINSLKTQINELRQAIIEIDNRTQIIKASEPTDLFAPKWPRRSGQGWVTGDYAQAIGAVRHFVEEKIVPRLEKLEEKEGKE